VQRRRANFAAWSDAVADVVTLERTADDVVDALVATFGLR